MAFDNHVTRLILATFCLCACINALPTPATNDMTMPQIVQYLEKYQYMGEKCPDSKIREMSKTDQNKALEMALTLFQQRYAQYKLTVTDDCYTNSQGARELAGEADAETIDLMMTPRCGVKDIASMNDMTKRKKRYMLSGTMWNKNTLTYKITQYPRDGDMSPSDVDNEIRRAFMVWEAVTPLHFVEIPRRDTRNVDIEIQFSVSVVDHGDGYPFDGPGRTLAHAFLPQGEQYPISGDSHFNEAEKWTLNTSEGINLFQVAAHEFGHALGLFHSEDPTALMAPFYGGYQPSFFLPEDDRIGIQSIYGPKPQPTRAPKPTNAPVATTTTKPTPKPTMGPATDLCRDPRFDAVTTMINNGEKVMYGFKGPLYFKLGNGRIADGYPRKIKDDWPDLPDSIDAGLFWDAIYEQVGLNWNDAKREWEPDNHLVHAAATFLFKGDKFYRVDNMKMWPGYPRDVSAWGIPNDIDAAFVWNTNGKTYFFKGRDYYKYTENVGVEPGYPRDISSWGGQLPEKIDTVIPNKDGTTTFFSGKDYFVYNDATRKIEYEGKIEPNWFNCDRFSDFRALSSSSATACGNMYSYISLIVSLIMIIRPF